MIYFVQGVDGGPIKIGTTVSLYDRIRELCCRQRKDLKILAVTEGGRREEYQYLVKFAHLKTSLGERHCEWFHPTADLLQLVEELAAKTPDSIRGRIVEMSYTMRMEQSRKNLSVAT
jgi:hypothetical protein